MVMVSTCNGKYIETTLCVYEVETFRRVVSEGFQRMVDYNGRDNKSHLLENANQQNEM